MMLLNSRIIVCGIVLVVMISLVMVGEVICIVV